jgi:hypothetical protein
MQEITITVKFKHDGIIPMDLLDQLSGIMEAQVEALGDGDISEDYKILAVSSEVTQTPGLA